MSQYLVERLRRASNVTIETRSQVVELSGDDRLRTVKIRDGEGRVVKGPVGGLFVMIGADPCTGWVKDAVRLDDRGFVLTGNDADASTSRTFFETSLPGVFAVGDVRSGSVKRVASAVGEGSVVVQAVHARLAAAPTGRSAQVGHPLMGRSSAPPRLGHAQPRNVIRGFGRPVEAAEASSARLLVKTSSCASCSAMRRETNSSSALPE